ncbi:hypothetical protein [Nonlabens dokdonensis]|uniref:Uncharacterized protein n=1 Tax=Nonlabens dokdonensis (strain DSM 17205 / KCTC 12402 / DSW-6) TaxID=592029 RepID=L7WE27_NONDD|nr:hypothetical protein [Nonlabens dokdonensis]AGC78201.1 hypothetical protein DDD_3074 [Nonlabens dokdonensis DSW-6]
MINVCKLDSSVLQEEFDSLGTKFLNQVGTIDYVKQDLFHALLALDFVERLGNPTQKADAIAYRSILKELWSEGLYAEKKTLLDSIFCDNKESSDTVNMTIRLDRFNLDIDKEILKFIEQVETQSNYGKKTIITDELSILKMEAMATRAQRSNDIITAARCLRSRTYLSNHDSLLMKSGMKFLLSQQCYDGSFGDYEADMLKIKDSESRDKSTLKIKLIVSIQIIWTVMEFNGHSLFSSLQRDNHYSIATNRY